MPGAGIQSKKRIVGIFIQGNTPVQMLTVNEPELHSTVKESCQRIYTFLTVKTIPKQHCACNLKIKHKGALRGGTLVKREQERNWIEQTKGFKYIIIFPVGC